TTSWRLRELLRFNDQLDIGLDIGIAPIPQIAGQSEDLINWATYWGNMVTLGRPNSAAAWKFLEWMSQPDQLTKLAQNIENSYGYFGMLYPRKDMAENLATNDYLKVFNESL